MRVFVSSTFVDLAAHREKIIRVLNGLNMSSAAMEYFGSRAADATELCLDEIEACDLFIGVYGWRYGYQPGGPDDRSITEQEFWKALELEKRILGFVAADETKPTEFDDATRPAQMLSRFKEEIGRRLVLDRFTTPEDLAWRLSIAVANELVDRIKVRAGKLGRTAWTRLPPQAAVHAMEMVTAEGTDLQTVELKSVAATLASLLERDGLERDGATGAARKADQVGRPEFFGSLIYDRVLRDFIAFDQAATEVLMRARARSADALVETLSDEAEKNTLRRFVALCRTARLIKADGTFNGVFLEDRVLNGRLSAPTSVVLECTRATTFHPVVSMCPGSLPLIDELRTSEVTALLDQMAAMACFRITLEGGEPLVRADLPALIDHANGQLIDVSLVTNGDAATPAVVDALKDVRLDAIRVRLEGASPRTCDSARGCAGAFDAACAGITRLQSLRVPIALQFLVTRDNMHELDAMAALVHSLGLQRLTVTVVAPLGLARHHADRLLSDDDITDVVAEIDRIRAARAVEIDRPRQPWNRLFKACCECGTLRCHVDARGGVSPAGILSVAAATDSLRGGTLEGIWRTSAAFEAWQNRPQQIICPACDYYAVRG